MTYLVNLCGCRGQGFDLRLAQPLWELHPSSPLRQRPQLDKSGGNEEVPLRRNAKCFASLARRGEKRKREGGGSEEYDEWQRQFQKQQQELDARSFY